MSHKSTRYQTRNWSIEVMNKPWFIDVLTYVLVGLWMALTFATIQQYGPRPSLLLAAVTVLAAGLFMIYNQRLTYLQIGDRIIIGMRGSEGEGDEEEPADWQRRNR